MIVNETWDYKRSLFLTMLMIMERSLALALAWIGYLLGKVLLTVPFLLP